MKNQHQPTERDVWLQGLIKKNNAVRAYQKSPTFKHRLVVENQKRDLWLQELDEDGDPTGNVYFIPQGWCHEYMVLKGFVSGPDNTDEDTGPELYCYAPTKTDWGPRGSKVELLWVGIDVLENMPESTEVEARKSHPNMARYVNQINNSETRFLDWKRAN